MHVIAVNYGRSPRGYSSASGAIAAAKAYPTQVEAKSGSAKLEGRLFVGGRCSLARWCLEFTGPIWLDVWCRDEEVAWSVVDVEPEFEGCVDSFAFKLPSDAETVIDPTQLLSERAGAPFWQLWVNDVGFYVYLRRKLILWFHSVGRLDNGKYVLYVSEDD